MSVDTRNLSIGLLLSLCMVAAVSVAARVYQEGRTDSALYVAESTF